MVDTIPNLFHSKILRKLMIRPILIELEGSDTAKCTEFGVQHKARGGKHGVIDPLCRKLLKLNASPKRTVEVRRDGVLCFEPLTLEWWAATRLHENDKTGQIRRGKYVENDWFKK